jgi:hypothetical protein
MDNAENTKKRRRDDDDDLPKAKIPHLDDVEPAPSTSSGYVQSNTYSTGLMDLSDEIWLAIFSQLDSETLYSLAK